MRGVVTQHGVVTQCGIDTSEDNDIARGGALDGDAHHSIVRCDMHAFDCVWVFAHNINRSSIQVSKNVHLMLNFSPPQLLASLDLLKVPPIL
jgi:hypothetical protein